MKASFKEFYNGDVRLEYTDKITGEFTVKTFTVVSCGVGVVTCNGLPVYRGLRQEGSDDQILTSSYDDLIYVIKREYRRMNARNRRFSKAV